MSTSARRRRLDYEGLLRAFPHGGPLVPEWRAYDSQRNAALGRPTTDPERALWYEMTLAVPSFDGPGSLRESWTAAFDLSTTGYPHSPPRVRVSPRPWHPHFFADGHLCEGRVWTKGTELARLATATISLLNWEPKYIDLDGGGGHCEPAAIEYWKANYRRPISDLVYPNLARTAPPVAKFGAPVSR